MSQINDKLPMFDMETCHVRMQGAMKCDILKQTVIKLRVFCLA